MNHKFCTKCLEDLPVTSFSKLKTGKFGVRSVCKVCTKEYNFKYNRDKSEKIYLLHKQWVKDNPDKAKSYSRKYRENNKQEISSRDKEYRNRNKDKVSSLKARYKINKFQATLKGYDKEIQEFYWLAKDLKAVSGESYHVDHIVPLRGRSVCGLHVPWNLQILPADLNMSKGNSFDATKEEYIAD